MDTGSALTGFLVLALIGGIYFLPTLIAVLSSRVNALPIFLVNLVFGWTFIGWFAALIWALTQGPQRNGRVCHD